MEVVIAIVAPLIVLGVGAIFKILLDIKGVMARDVERWERQEELWEQNASDHKTAFKSLAELKAELKEGQHEIKERMVRVETKLDTALGDK